MAGMNLFCGYLDKENLSCNFVEGLQRMPSMRDTCNCQGCLEALEMKNRAKVRLASLRSHKKD